MSGPATDIEAELLRFIAEELLEDLYDGRDPLATGALDSLAHEQLVEYIVEEFGVPLSGEEMVGENFESIPILAAFIESKRSGGRLG